MSVHCTTRSEKNAIPDFSFDRLSNKVQYQGRSITAKNVQAHSRNLVQQSMHELIQACTTNSLDKFSTGEFIAAHHSECRTGENHKNVRSRKTQDSPKSHINESRTALPSRSGESHGQMGKERAQQFSRDDGFRSWNCGDCLSSSDMSLVRSLFHR